MYHIPPISIYKNGKSTGGGAFRNMALNIFT